MEINLSKSQTDSLVRWLLEKINKNEFIIIQREKNKDFMNQYRLNLNSVKENILSKISSSNFVSEEFDRDTFVYGILKV